MPPLSRVSSTLALFAALILLGAGCTVQNPFSTDTETATTTPSTTTPTSTTADPGVITASSTLDTTGWQTYQNKTLKFEFQYPLRGKFAPQFEVKLFPLTYADIQNDCYGMRATQGSAPDMIQVNGTTFCRINVLEGAAGSTINQDYWTTKNDKWYAVITFSKKYLTDPRIQGGCEEGGVDVGKPRCAPFDVAGYRAHLSDIMSTFRYPTSQN
jgi:hypothetical protein